MAIFRKFWKRFPKVCRHGAGSAILAAALAASAGANPTGPTVRNGQVVITPGTQAQIQQLTDRAIVDWQSFSIGLGESVQFIQPGQLSVILNRVTGADPSAILGSLRANGQVFLINPNGILFGPGATVDVGGLVATTLNITDESFLSGNYSFFQEEGKDLAAVVNQGSIRITDGGYAVLTGPTVINEGAILARTGNVVLASGEQATLNLDGRDLVHFALVGQVSDGTVLLAPGMMSDTLAQTFGVTPELRADKLVRLPDGSVRMVSSSGTTVQNGQISVNGRDGQDAGDVLIDSADVTLLGQNSVTTADGVGADSDGGDLLVLSAMDGSRTLRGFTDVQEGSLLSAQGGASGDGGFIEVSGDGVNLLGDFNLEAVDGRDGDFLLDPVLVTIVDGDNAPTTVTNPLTLTSNTIIGDAWFESPAFSGFTTFTLESTGDILFDLGTAGNNPTGDGTFNFRGGAGSVALTLIAGTDAVEVGGINFGDDGISLTGLTSLDLQADGNILFGDASLDVDGALTINTTGGTVDFQTANLDVFAPVTTNSFTVNAATDIDLGNSNIEIRDTGGNAVILLDAGGNLDFGTSDFFFDGLNNNAVSSTFRAGQAIRSDGPDGVAGFNNTITVDGATLFEAGTSVTLRDADIRVARLNTNGASLTFDAQGGVVDLRDSQLLSSGAITVTSTADTVLDNAALTATAGNGVDENISILSGGSLSFVGGSINNGLLGSPNNTGTLVMTAVNDITLGATTIVVSTNNGGGSVVNLSAGGTIDLATADIDIIESDSIADILFDAGVDLDFGTASIFFDGQNNNQVTTTFRAGQNILSAGPNTITVDGQTLFEAGAGVSLQGAQIQVARLNTTGAPGLTIEAQGGSLDLSNGDVTSNGNLTLMASADVLLNGADLTATQGNGSDENISIDSGASISFVGGTINNGLAGSIVNTGTLQMTAMGDITLGNNTILLSTNNGGGSVFEISAGGNIDLAAADIDIIESDSTADVLIDAGLDLDFGTASIFFDGVNNNQVTTTFRAGRNILSDGSNTITVDGRTLFEAGNGVSLQGSQIQVARLNTTGVAGLTFDAQGGSLDLINSNITSSGNLTLNATADVLLNGAALTATQGNGIDENISVNSGASISFIGGSINSGLSGSTANTGTLEMVAANDITLGSNTIVLSTDNGSGSVFELRAGGTIDLAAADIDIFESDSTADVLFEAGLDLDFGTADIFFDGLNNNQVTTTFRAGRDILSAGPNSIMVDGATSFEATNGIALQNAQIQVARSNTTGVAGLTFDAQSGALDLSGSQVTSSGALTLMATGNVVLDGAGLTATMGNGLDEQILINAGDSVSFVDGSINNGLLGSVNSTGTVEIRAMNDITFGDNTIEVNTDNNSGAVFTLAAGGIIDLAGSDIDILERDSTADILLDAGLDLDFGSADLLFDGLNNNGVTSTFRSGRNILSDSGNTITVDGVTLFEATNGISLQNAQIQAARLNTSGARLTFDAQGGAIDLSGSQLTSSGGLSLMATGEVVIDGAGLTATMGNGLNENIVIDAGDSVSFVDGSVNQGLLASVNSTGTLDIRATNNITLGNNTIEINTDNGSGPVFTVAAGGIVDLAGSDIDIVERSGTADILIDAGLDLEFGSSDIFFDAQNNNAVTSTFRAGRNILSDDADGMASFVNVIAVDGVTLFEATTGSLTLNDASIQVSNLNISSQPTLDITAVNGDVTLGESSLLTSNDILVLANGTLDAQSAQITTPQRVAMSANGSVNADGSMVQASDLEIFGFNTMTSLPDPTIPVANSVRLDLSTQSAGDVIELSVFSGGDITINHTGDGTIRTERADADLASTGLAPYAIRSQGGNITIQGENRLELGGGDANFASVHSDDLGTNTPVVLVGGSEILDLNPALDIFSPGELVIQATRAAGVLGAGGALEVRGEAITLDMSQLETGFLDNVANIVIDNGTLDLRFLDVSGNNSDITIVELGSTPEFRVEAVSTGPNLLTMDALGADNFIYTEHSNEGIELESIAPGFNKKVAIETINGPILGDPGTSNDTQFDGDLLLVSGGDIGTQADPFRVESARVAARAGGNIFLESQSDELVIADQIVVENFTGTAQPTGQGVQAQGDVEIALVPSGGPTRNLRLEGGVSSTNGGVALVVPDGDLFQTGGEIAGPQVALQVSGNAGTFDENDLPNTTEIATNAGQLVLNVGGDAIINQANGNLSLEGQTTIAGETYTAGNPDGDLRVRAGTGDIAVNTDFTAGQDLGIVTGNTSTIGQTTAGSITLNGSLTADGGDPGNGAGNLVIISGGNVVFQSGVLTANQIGLGANGTVGAATAPVNINANGLALSPFLGSVTSGGTFQTVNQVGAVGLSVNQATAPAPDPPVTPDPPVVPNPIPIPIPEPDTVVLDRPEFDIFEEDGLLAQNQVDLVEDVLEMIIETEPEQFELDPTRLPLRITDEDFLNKKFRK